MALKETLQKSNNKFSETLHNTNALRVLNTILVLLIVLLNYQYVVAQNRDQVYEVKATFVAYNWLYPFQSPTSARQLFVANIDLVDEKADAKLAKLMYFPRPSSTYEGINYLKIEQNYYLNRVSVWIREPISDESAQCKHYVNFLDKGSKTQEPQMMFSSFQYNSFMTFEFDEMKCYVLVSVGGEDRP